MQITVKELMRALGEERATVSWLAARRTLEYTFEVSQAMLRVENVEIKRVRVNHPYDLTVLRLDEPVNVFLTHLSDETLGPKHGYSIWLKHADREVPTPEVVVSVLPKDPPAIDWVHCRVGSSYKSNAKASEAIGVSETVYRICATDVPEHLRNLAPLPETAIREIVVFTQPYTKDTYTYERVVGMRYFYDHLPELSVRFANSWQIDPLLMRVVEYDIDLRWRCGVLATPIGMTMDLAVGSKWENFPRGIPTAESWAEIQRRQAACRAPRTAFEAQQQSEPSAKGTQA